MKVGRCSWVDVVAGKFSVEKELEKSEQTTPKVAKFLLLFVPFLGFVVDAWWQGGMDSPLSPEELAQVHAALEEANEESTRTVRKVGVCCMCWLTSCEKQCCVCVFVCVWIVCACDHPRHFCEMQCYISVE